MLDIYVDVDSTVDLRLNFYLNILF